MYMSFEPSNSIYVRLKLIVILKIN